MILDIIIIVFFSLLAIIILIVIFRKSIDISKNKILSENKILSDFLKKEIFNNKIECPIIKLTNIKQVDEIIYKIAKFYNIEIIQIQENDEYCLANGKDVYINTSYVIGKKIYMGIYKDHDIKFISFFHEMGHILIPEEEIEKCKTKYDVEERAWRYGMDLAESLNVRFSYDAIQWAKRQLKSYRIK